MRIALISDIHGNRSALRAVLDAIQQQPRPVERVICLGDIVGRGPHPNEVIELLREQDVESVRGNYDDAVANDRVESGNDFADDIGEEADRRAVAWTRRTLTPENLAYLQELPRDLRLFPGVTGVRVRRDQDDERTSEFRRNFFTRALFGGLVRSQPNPHKRVIAMHGSPRALNEFIRQDTARSVLASIADAAQADVLLSGHAAEGFQRQENRMTFVGVGSVSGLRSTVGLAEYAVVDIGPEVRAVFESVEYDGSEHQEGVDENRLPGPLRI